MPKLWICRGRVLVCLAAAFAVAGGSQSAAQTWREVDSAHFRVITDGADKDGRDVAKEFEQMRSVFAARFKNASLETGAPLLIFAVREPDLKALAPSLVKDSEKFVGQFFKGWERQYAMVRLDSFGDQNQAVVFHEYTHSIMHANLHWLPMWLDEGLAEFYAYTRFQGDRIYVGAPSSRYHEFNGFGQMPVAEMMKVRSLGSDVHRNGIFYAQAWAMVHYMTFGSDMGHGAKLNAFIHSLEGGTPQEQAFQEVFGDTKKFNEKLAEYVSKPGLTADVMPPAPGLDAKSFPVKMLSAAETSYEIGCFDIGVHDRATARKRLLAAEESDPSLGGPYEEVGFLDWVEGRDEEAKTDWRKAVADDAGLYRSAFALLMSGKPLRAQNEQELQATRLALEEIKAKAPKFAPVVAELALVQWRLGQMHEAYEDAMAAQRLEPWRAGYRLLTGYILLQEDAPKLAADYARTVAAQWPGADHDEALDLWNQVPASARGNVTLTFAGHDGTTVERGTIVDSSCSKNGLSVTLRPSKANAESLTVVGSGPYESGFSDTLWFGEDHFTPCYHLAGLPVVVKYEAAADGTHKLIGLEIRDDLPALKPAEETPAAAPTAQP